MHKLVGISHVFHIDIPGTVFRHCDTIGDRERPRNTEFHIPVLIESVGRILIVSPSCCSRFLFIHFILCSFVLFIIDRR